MGNSEVGHLNLGAGAIVTQDLLRIDEAVEDGTLAENEVLRAALRATRPRVHLLGLVSDGGVHASTDHLKALIELAGREGVADVVIHAFTDGRDTAPTGGADVPRRGRRAGAGARIGDGHRALLRDGPRQALGPHASWPTTCSCTARPSSAPTAARRPCAQAYERGETDEFIKPTLVGRRGARIRDGDAVIFFNFRPDRARQITHARALRRARARPRHAHHAHRVPGGLGLPGRVPARARPDVTLASTLAERGIAPAARGRDREVRRT